MSYEEYRNKIGKLFKTCKVNGIHIDIKSLEDIRYGTEMKLKLGQNSYITGVFQGVVNSRAINISGHMYSLNTIKEIETKDKNKLDLGDIVEVTNIYGLNRVLYDEYPKGFNKNLIGLQGMITMIDDVTTKGITYYVVDLPIENPRIHDMRYLTDGRTVFLKENLKLIKKENKSIVNKLDNIYIHKEVGIRKDYLYEIDTKSSGCLIGEILNFDYNKYVVKEYKINGEFNHHVLKFSDILELHPSMTIDKFSTEIKYN
jgi:hypothetical protein